MKAYGVYLASYKREQEVTMEKNKKDLKKTKQLSKCHRV